MIMRMAGLVALTALAFTAAEAAAKTTYLSCSRTNGSDGRLREKFSLNESDRSGTHSIPETGLSSGRLPADFGQDVVQLMDVGDMTTDAYFINRTNLSYTLVRVIGDYPPDTDKGKCVVAAPPAGRKF